MKIFYTVILVLVLIAMPLWLGAETDGNSGLVPCGFGNVGPEDCTFNHLLILAQNVMNFLIFTIALPVAVVLIIFAGGKMVWYSTTPGKHQESLNMIKNVAIGLFIMLAAYVIIQQVLSFFISEEPDNPINQAQDRLFESQP